MTRSLNAFCHLIANFMAFKKVLEGPFMKTAALCTVNKGHHAFSTFSQTNSGKVTQKKSLHAIMFLNYSVCESATERVYSVKLNGRQEMGE